MPKVLRTKPSFLPLINGVKFEPCEGGSVSEDVTKKVAEAFASLDGYELADAGRETAAERKARLEAEAEAEAEEKAKAEAEAEEKAKAEAEAKAKAEAEAAKKAEDAKPKGKAAPKAADPDDAF